MCIRDRKYAGLYYLQIILLATITYYLIWQINVLCKWIYLFLVIFWYYILVFGPPYFFSSHLHLYRFSRSSASFLLLHLSYHESLYSNITHSLACSEEFNKETHPLLWVRFHQSPVAYLGYLVPVSYTHLDVYKRQGFSNESFSVSAENLSWGGGIVTG